MSKRNSVASSNEWETFRDAPQWVQEAASLIATIPGATPEQVAAYLGHSPETMRRVMASPAIQARIRELEFKIIQRNSALTEELSALRVAAITRAREKLPEASVKEALDAAKFASDYHPDRLFVKVERREEKHTHEHQVSGKLLEEIKQRALTVSARPAITVDAEVIDDDG